MPSEKPTIRTDIPGSAHYLRSPSSQPQSLTVHHDEKRKLTVGRDITLAGEITRCDHLVVEGSVEAELHGGRRLDVSPTGVFRGTVEIQDMDLSGVFEGNLVVFGKLVIRATGRMVGNVQYGELEVHTGGMIEGSIAALPPEVVQVYPSKKSEDSADERLPEPSNDSTDVEKDSEEVFGEMGVDYKTAVGQ